MSGIRSNASPTYLDSSKEATRKRKQLEDLMGLTLKGKPSDNNSMMQHMVPGVSIAVIHKGKLDFAAAYSQLEDEPLTLNTLFQAASVSKPVSAMGALRLAEIGLIRLTDDIRSALKPGTIKFESDELERIIQKIPITLKNLLAHVAGFNGPGTGFNGYAMGEVYPTVMQIIDGEIPAKNEAIKIVVPPGKELKYSGGGYTVMQILLERIYEKNFGKKKSFSDIMKDEVFKKLGMTSSSFNLDELLENKLTIAKGHDETGANLIGDHLHYPELAAAGLWTTPSDLFLYVNEILSGVYGKKTKVLSSDMIREMLTEQLPLNNNGLGLLVRTDESGKLISFEHPGTNKGFTSDLFVSPETGYGIIVMTNADNGHSLAEDLMRTVQTIYYTPNIKQVFYSDLSLFSKLNTHLEGHRHDDPKLQKEYDNRFGLTTYKK